MISLLLFIPLVVYPLLRALYNITLHPLAKYPGPKLYAAFDFPRVYQIARSQLGYKVRALHDRYGPVVRISPNELSFVSAQAWRDIYGARAPQNPKDLFTYIPPDGYEGKRMVMERSDAKHQAWRHQLSHAFAPKALLEHQPLINEYIDKLVSLCRGSIPSSKPLDMTAHFNWTTFDIIGHLTFGDSFHCLDTSTTHPWIKVIFEGVAAGHTLNQLSRYGLLNLVMKFIPKSLQKPRDDMLLYSDARMEARIQKGFGPGTRKDFAYFMRNGPEKRDGEQDSQIEVMSKEVMCANGETLVITGSETTATLLAAMSFLLLTKRPDYLERMKQEVRTAFANDSLNEINFRTVTEKLPLTIAAIKEALRYYPPVPCGFARTIEDTPKSIDDNLIPVGSSVSVCQWAASHYKENWFAPEEFLPERWMEDATWPGSIYEDDQRDAVQPFSMGPRNCLGRTLAEVEIRLVYAKLLFNFDFELVEGQEDWISKQTQSLIWGKGPLMIRFKEAAF